MLRGTKKRGRFQNIWIYFYFSSILRKKINRSAKFKVGICEDGHILTCMLDNNVIQLSHVYITWKCMVKKMLEDIGESFANVGALYSASLDQPCDVVHCVEWFLVNVLSDEIWFPCTFCNGYYQCEFDKCRVSSQKKSYFVWNQIPFHAILGLGNQVHYIS